MLEPIWTGAGGILHLPAESGEPLHRRVYFALRDAILAGRLPPGQRLPSTRALAATLGLARNTVLAAYDQLAAEGYVEGRPGAGTVVRAALGEAPALPDRPLAPHAPPRPSALARRLAGHRVHPPSGWLPFRPGVPALEEFPWDVWGRLLRRRWRRPGPALTLARDNAGLPALREAVAAWLRESRALRCSAEQVLIVGGGQQALDLAARLLLDPGDVAAVEDPGFSGADAALTAAGATLTPVPVDAAGLVVEALPERARAVLVTPSRNFPLGVTLSLERRLALLAWARRAGAWVIEDDYDSEFRFDGRPVASLQGLDEDGRVVYLGTFSRVLFPGLRLGYLVVPEGLAATAQGVRGLLDGGPSTVHQAALADLFAEGWFAGHLRAMRALYARRRSVLVEALSEHLGDSLAITGADGGMHLSVTVPDDTRLVAVLARQRVEAAALSAFHRGAAARSGLVLGFAGWPEPVLRAACERLSRALVPWTAGGRLG
ncbi:PLP-dependent aminotransferase family protein [Novispirillum sp. DQ9]|uniref:MocR-like pyridoxine biosynthesis transcription factor PdxR n=1 Tax=Novispirillum sp. DQ9 TaxID=3398612 RepID=UPI003C7AF719